ncbi:MAG: DNA/RNA non-specific endonuclease [Saprospiraceae bacterium]|nr:DNA/RNA non-specific endonuclease [Saprospiraceae bacterium]
MAKFRRAHTRQSANSSRIVVVAIVGAIILIGIGLALKKMGKVADEQVTFESTRHYFPEGKNDLDVVQHEYYALGYDEDKEGAAWVAYELFGKNVSGPWVKRTDDFRNDPKVPGGSASNADFKGNGYDRGHLVPAGDMAFNETAMSETFFMSNISPQERAFNHGVWRELEELVRDWAKSNSRMVVVSGPIWEDNQPVVGKATKMVVPDAYFKVLLDIDLPEQKAIGFVIPNSRQTERLDAFAMSVDEVEAKTGFDFFSKYIEPSLQEKIESEMDLSLWPLNEKKYRIRVERWNKE